MSVHQTKKYSDLEKRLRILSQQLYGKKEKLDVRNLKMDNEVGNLSSNIQHPTSNTDISYLKQDLTKILIFSSLALIFELSIYFSQLYSKIKIF